MTRILLCANNIDEIGGAQRVLHVLAGGLQGRGHDVRVVGITPHEPRHDFRETYPRSVLMPSPWPSKGPRTERIRTGLRAEAVARMLELLKGVDQPSVLICTQVWAMEVVTDAMAALTPTKRSQWSVIGQYHGSFAAAASGRDLGRILRSYAAVAMFTALTVEDARAFARAGLNNARAMPNPLAFWPDAPTDRGDRESPVLLYLGRLSEEKGVDLLIEAWSLIADRHQSWRLRIVGDGPQAASIRTHASSLAGADRIQWRAVTEDPEASLMDADLLVLPSRTEGLPLVLAEAQACEVPVVATDCSSGVRELVGDWGSLVPPGDSRVLATALDVAMSDPHWRRASGLRGRLQMQRYRLDAILDEWERTIERALL